MGLCTFALVRLSRAAPHGLADLTRLLQVCAVLCWFLEVCVFIPAKVVVRFVHVFA